MGKRFVAAVSFVIVASLAWAKMPVRQWIVSMPDSVMPLLTRNNRLDFIDFVDSGMEAVVTNRLDGKSRMTMLSEDFASIEYTKSSVVAMKLLPLYGLAKPTFTLQGSSCGTTTPVQIRLLRTNSEIFSQ